MPDPAVVPWHWCWIGLAVVITGGLWAVWFAVRPHRSSTAIRLSLAVLAVGVAMMVYPAFVNGTVFLARAIIEYAQPKSYESPDQRSGLFLTSWRGL